MWSEKGDDKLRENEREGGASLFAKSFMATLSPSDHALPSQHDENPMPSLEEVLALLQIPKESVLNVYPYGSHLYGLARPDSGMFPFFRSWYCSTVPFHTFAPVTARYKRP